MSGIDEQQQQQQLATAEDDNQQQQNEADELAALLDDHAETNNNENSKDVSPSVIEPYSDTKTHADAAAVSNIKTSGASGKKSKISFPLPVGTTVESLFGPHFQPRRNPIDGSDVPLDPAEVDIASIITEHFGIEDWASLAFLPEDNVRVIDPNLLVFQEGEGCAKGEIEDRLEGLIVEHEGFIARDEIAEIFGAEALKLVVESIRKSASADEQQLPTQMFSLPRPPAARFVPDDADQQTKRDEQNSESWLLHLPTIYPNRRSAHIERGPYVPGLTIVRKQSSDRAIYTPLNVLRWAFDESRDVSLSNARLVQWSTGAWTLHIGSDVYAIAPDKTQTLVVVGQEVENTLPEFAPPGISNADRIFVETAPYTKRVQLLPSGGDAGHSVETFLVAEGRVTSVQKNPESVVKLVTAPVTVSKPAVPGQPKDSKKVRIEGSAELAEFIALKDKERERLLRQSNNGRAPTIFERFAFDATVLENIRTAQMGDAEDFSNLVNKFKDEVAAATAANTRNQQFGNQNDGFGGKQHGKSGKLDRRDLTLGDELMMVGNKIKNDGNSDGDVEEEDEGEQLLSSGTRRKRNGQDAEADDQEELDSLLASREDVLERLIQMKRTPGLNQELVEEIEGLYQYFNDDTAISLENMLSEVSKIEEKIIQEVSEAAMTTN